MIYLFVLTTVNMMLGWYMSKKPSLVTYLFVGLLPSMVLMFCVFTVFPYIVTETGSYPDPLNLVGYGILAILPAVAGILTMFFIWLRRSDIKKKKKHLYEENN